MLIHESAGDLLRVIKDVRSSTPQDLQLEIRTALVVAIYNKNIVYVSEDFHKAGIGAEGVGST